MFDNAHSKFLLVSTFIPTLQETILSFLNKIGCRAIVL